MILPKEDTQFLTVKLPVRCALGFSSVNTVSVIKIIKDNDFSPKFNGFD